MLMMLKSSETFEVSPSKVHQSAAQVIFFMYCHVEISLEK